MLSRGMSLLLALTATGCAEGAAAAPPTLTDADLVAYAAKPFDKAAMAFKHVVMGVHHGITVLADFPCSDVCPQYTRRIVHYDLDPGPGCEAKGGVTETRFVPVSIATAPRSFCI